MTKELEIVSLPEEHEDESVLIRIAATALKIQPNKISSLKILKRSIDAYGIDASIDVITKNQARVPDRFFQGISLGQ